MALILDTDAEIFIVTDAADMARQLLGRLAEEPDDETPARLAAAVLECDVLDVVITRTNHP